VTLDGAAVLRRMEKAFLGLLSIGSSSC